MEPISKAFLVVEGQYSAKVTRGVFVDRAIAEEWVQELVRDCKYSDARIEEHAVLRARPQRRVMYIVAVGERGEEKFRWTREDWDVPDAEFAEEDATRTAIGARGWSPRSYDAALKAARAFLASGG